MTPTEVINIKRSTFDDILARLNTYDAGICGGQNTASTRHALKDTPTPQQVYLERFTKIAHSWNPEAVWRTVNNFPPSMVDEMIEKCQRRVDDNLPLPQKRKLTKIRREKVYKPNIIELKKLLAARVVQEEYEYMMEEGLLPHNAREKKVPVTVETLSEEARAKKAMQKKEVEWMAMLSADVLEAQRKKMEALRDGRAEGHWGFDGEQNEYIAKYLFEGKCNAITADIVYRAKMARTATPYSLALKLKWVEDPTTEAEEPVTSSTNISGEAEQSETQGPSGSTSVQQSASAEPSKKSLIVRLPINFARLQTLNASKTEVSSESSSADNEGTISKSASKAVTKMQPQNALPRSPSDDASDNTRKKSLRVKPKSTTLM